MTPAQIKHLVDRFLGWHLPADFNPDGGISFKPTFNDHLPTPQRHDPTGTHLFTADQAEAMFRYVAEGMPESRDETAWLIETANTTYWDGRGFDAGNFTSDHSKAMRFARADDAAIVISWLLDKYAFALKPVEHMWMKP